MKKLLIALAMVACAAGLQAASFNWGSSAKAYGVNAAGVTDNGVYAAGTTQMKGQGTWTFVLSIYEYGTDTLVGSANGTLSFGSTGKITTNGITIDEAVAGTQYDYVAVITGTQNTLTARGEDTAAGFDYTAAVLTTTMEGSITVANNGATGLSTSAPSSWTVSGVEPLPEPTSGLLLLLGMAGLALRRKQK